MPEKNETTVVDTPVSVDPTPTQETVTSPEVKVEAPVEATPQVQTNDVDVAKMQVHVENLNTALKQEREASRLQNEEFTAKLEQSQELNDKLKNVFSPEQPEEETPAGATMDQIEEMLNRREAKTAEEAQKETQAQQIQAEVKTMQDEWNGENGKPQYDDKKVLDWQEGNSKMHLSPREAFNEMNRDSIIDWEIKERMAKKPEVQNVETPGATQAAREPVAQAPKGQAELRNAVLDAMSAASSENNN